MRCFGIQDMTLNIDGDIMTSMILQIFERLYGPFEIEGISIEGQYMGMTSLVRLRLSMPIDDLCIPDSMLDLMVFNAHRNQFGISQFN